LTLLFVRVIVVVDSDCSFDCPKGSIMPEHAVTVSIPPLSVGPADVEFIVDSDDDRFGRLRVSKGGLDWHPKDAKKPYRMSWEEFDRVLQTEWGYR
jgi:hypothetical protein